MAEPIKGPELLALRAAIARYEQHGGVHGDKPLILRQAAALLAETDRLHTELAHAHARPWEIHGPRLFDDLVDVIKHDTWGPEDKAKAIITVLGLKGIVAIDLSRDYQRAQKRVRALEAAATDVVTALKAAPRLALVEPAGPGYPAGTFVVELYEDGELIQCEPAAGNPLRHWLYDLRHGRDRWDVRLGWELRGEPAPEGFPAIKVSRDAEAAPAGPGTGVSGG